ncbi:MAG TPA: iron-containing redox enzyme family protein, partial [Actinomycetota bacterium]
DLLRTHAPDDAITGPRPDPDADPLDDDDLHLSLYLCIALGTHGIDGVDEGWEWAPSLVAVRRDLERRFEGALRERVPIARLAPQDVPSWLVGRSRQGEGRLSRFLAREATLDQFREFVVHRSIYTRHEADPHTLVIPRLQGAAKAALVEIQADEYGGGTLARMHAEIFGATMTELGLDPRPDAYVDAVPASTLATVNLVWMMGNQRRLRGAAVGHLALFELTSAVPNRAYGNGLRRLGLDGRATDYYDEHVEADSVHDMIAAYDLAGALAREEPGQVPQIVFGAGALDLLEDRFGTALLAAWHEGGSSLRVPLPRADASGDAQEAVAV